MPIGLTIALDRSEDGHALEAKYVLRTLARLAGFGTRFVWADAPGTVCDICYSPNPERARAMVRIRAGGPSFADLRGREPDSFIEHDGLGLLGFDQEKRTWSRAADSVQFDCDI